ncbi:ATP-binding protein [Dactylosporangium sp. NPDC051541]|uniref:ATP-binding protein n=1 Tax=Dactylosporangium sp. NPDC051541 TaxID=3363977 RepID=UPI003789300F
MRVEEDQVASVTLPPLLDATAAARHLVGRACCRWGFEPVRDVAELIVTELVSNVLRHAGTEMEISVSRDGRRLLISVYDGGSGMPRLGGRAAREMLPEDGRGLLVVSALARAWGCIPVPGGKVVWVTVGI